MYRVPAASLVLMLFAACSSSKTPTGTTPAPETQTPPTTQTSDASAPDSGPQPQPGTEACLAKIAYDQRCADTAEMKSDACASGRKTDCDKVVQEMAAAYRAAVVACYTPQLQCGDDDACITEKLTGTAPTAAMLKLRDDYCTTCGTEVGPTCKDDFYTLSQTDGNGDGYLILQFSDDIVQAIDNDCTGSKLDKTANGATSCREAFFDCVSTDQYNAVPALPDVCYPQAPAQNDDGGT